MTSHDPIEINGTEFDPVLVECPVCGGEIDAQRALLEGACPAPDCRATTDDLLDRGDEAPPEDYEPESYKVEA
jgi:hypothetical protein